MDFPKLEEKILEFWRKNKIFEKSLKQRQGARPFGFYEGPPFPNTAPPLHSFLARAFKDLIPRYQTMRGRYVLRRAGWDVHGLPIELLLERELGLKSKSEIEKYGIDRFNKAAETKVWGHKADWDRFTERIGFWLDLENAYITSSPSYIESVWWILGEIWKKGLLEQDYKVVPWCVSCGTALSSHEVAMGYDRVKDPALFIKFKVRGQMSTHSASSGLMVSVAEPSKVKGLRLQNAYILAWTTTPWTLPGNVGLAVHPKLVYSVIRQGKETYILAKELLKIVSGEYEVLKELKGKELVGLRYEPLFDALAKAKPKNIQNAFQVLPGDFVSGTDGTGVVHTAVMYGEDDFELGRKHNLPMRHTVDERGRFTKDVKPWQGRFVKDVEREITEDLKARGLLFKEEIYEHDYPFCWRCSSPLLYYARSSWFIRMRKLRNKLIKNNDEINWVPAYLKEGRFGEFIRDVKDWALSRERYWGTPLPVWICKDCGKKEAIGSLEELNSKSFTARTKLVLLRHTEAETNRKDVLSSWPEKKKYHLTEKGKKQALALIAQLAKEKIDLIVSSDIARAKETAKIIASALKTRLLFDKRLREIKMGVFEGKKEKEYWKFHRAEENEAIAYAKAPKNGESMNDVKKRMLDFSFDMQKRFPGKKLLVVGHGDPLWILSAALSGYENKRAFKDKSFYFHLGSHRTLPVPNIPFDEDGNLNLHRPWVDNIHLRCKVCNSKMSRVKEVIDVWFDSGSMPFAEWHYPFENREMIDRGKHFPADFIAEGIDMTRGWFYTLLAVSTALGKPAPYKNVLSLGLLLDEKGEKMSKSKGNVVNPWEMFSRYGADALRWYFYTVNSPAEPKRFATREVEDRMRKFISLLWNSLQFYELYSTTDNLQLTTYNYSSHILDRWLLARLKETVATTTRELERYEIRGAALALEKLVDDLSHWYIRRSRARFQPARRSFSAGGKPKNRKEAGQARQTLRFALVEIAKLAAPFTPFLAEEIYQNIGWKTKQSVHLEDWPGRTKLSKQENELIKSMSVARKIASLALSERAKAGIKVRQPLNELRIKNYELRNKKELLGLLKEEINVKEIIFDAKLEKEIALDATITPALREEGILREIVRTIQDLRREAKLMPQDKIVLWINAKGEFSGFLERNKKNLLKETGAKQCNLTSLPRGSKTKKTLELEGNALEIALRKAS